MSVSTFFKLYKWYQLRNASHIVFVVVFESLQHINLEFLFLTLNIYLLPSYIIKVRKHLAFWESRKHYNEAISFPVALVQSQQWKH